MKNCGDMGSGKSKAMKTRGGGKPDRLEMREAGYKKNVKERSKKK